jgi:CelD/BcsL family acetyltransferase involved in cellulose biosynthesis
MRDPQWRAFVQSRSEATAFHEPAWADVLERSYGFESFALALVEADSNVVAGMPVVELRALTSKRWVSFPFSDACTPLGSADDVELLLDELTTEMTRKHVGGVEIRGNVPGTAVRRSSRGVVHTLALRKDPSELLKTFSRSQVRRNIARAARENVTVRWGERRDDLLETFLRLHLSTRKRHGLPAQPRAFFENLWDSMIEPGHGFVLVSRVDEIPAAAAVFLVGGKTITYKFGASEAELWHKRPNHPLFWEAIQWGCRNGYEILDFGRSDHENVGLRAFKDSWGTIETELLYSIVGTKPLRPPEALVSAIGPLIRHSPMWLNRILGRLLYRFAG